MKLIIGLGNPEKDYKGTKHNVGFEVINKLAYDYNININKAKFKAHLGEGFIENEKVILVKPQTYMNLSGESVKEILNFYKLKEEDIIVAYDDINLPIEDIRIREKGSAGGHNGIKNIIYHLNTDIFIRVKIGIGLKPPKIDLSDYVLSRFKKQDEEKIINGITKAGDSIVSILRIGVENTMNKFN